MEDLRAYQLSYCTVCKHRKVDWRNIIQCGLTNELADFKKDCKFFSFDFNRHNQLKDVKKLEIEREYEEYLDQYDNLKFIDRVEKTHYKDLRETNNIKIRKNFDFLYLMYLLLPMLFLFLYLKHKEEIANHTIGNLAITSFYIIPLLLIALTVYILVNFNKIEFKTDELGFIFKNKRYYWNEILIVMKLTLPPNSLGVRMRSGSDSRVVLLGTKSRGLVELLLNNTNIDQQKLIEMILLNRDLVLQKAQYIKGKGDLDEFIGLLEED